MSYRYEFDDTRVGDVRLRRPGYETLHAAYGQLRDALKEWNQRALDNGAHARPYEREVDDLDSLIEWGDEQLAGADARDITHKGMSVASARYAKAALVLMMHRRREDRALRAEEGWPDAVLRSLGDTIDGIEKIADGFEQEPSDVLWELIPRDDTRPPSPPSPSHGEWDVFISHASEDKDEFVRPLAQALQTHDLSVWFDEFTLTVGDSLRRSIDRGLARSRFGVVVISPNFLDKEWPQKELDGLVAREIDGTKVILPVWHNISADRIRSYSPMLADRIATRSSDGLHRVVDDLTEAIAAAPTGAEISSAS